MRMQPQNVVVVLRSCCCCCCCLRVFGAQLGLCCCNRTINAAAQHEPSPVRVRVLCVCEGTRTGFAFSLLPLSPLSALLFFCGSLQFGLVSLLRSFGRRRRSSRRHHGASLSLSPYLSLFLAHKLWLLPNLILAPFQASSCCYCGCCRRRWCERVITLIIIIYERWQYKSGETQSDGYPD